MLRSKHTDFELFYEVDGPFWKLVVIEMNVLLMEKQENPLFKKNKMAST